VIKERWKKRRRRSNEFIFFLSSLGLEELFPPSLSHRIRIRALVFLSPSFSPPSPRTMPGREESFILPSVEQLSGLLGDDVDLGVSL